MTLPAPLAEVVSDFADVAGPGQAAAAAGVRQRTAGRCPPIWKRRRWSRCPSASRRCSCTSTRSDPSRVRLYFSAPAEAPTTRGFASILAAGLDEQSAADILAVPDDFYTDLGLAALISPLRLRGMSAMLARIKRRLARDLRHEPRSSGTASPGSRRGA